ncbi:hypothetical protein K493DRAFT_364122 [Basidiobolus meristosporus CBS 931.73]|uniref:Uncharacterized protein n=1 Tax=Basidiobolus meristosporus CBS 931.73 TaxID=1314790 RepID=A0A1Y1WPF4_9FUNG|nr:hypothetical protein K493DRAFT_364122 [Basidiobolus meristosporus CBS 931.73]|eukprot:ORX75421.1 hypothetical protein K493DRAFT_364122 [Basidiobolus meristosporus CBS 931.73]
MNEQPCPPFLSKRQSSPPLPLQEIPHSFEATIGQLTGKSFHLSPTQMSPSPPESICEESDLELEIDRALSTGFNHKKDKRVHDYHHRLHKRYNGMMGYLQKQTTTYWK